MKVKSNKSNVTKSEKNVPWVCSHCGNLNYINKTFCEKCGKE